MLQLLFRIRDNVIIQNISIAPDNDLAVHEHADRDDHLQVQTHMNW
jgi:hypothetical protein